MSNLDLGAFSVSLSVKDLDTSRAFYEKLGFEVTGGAAGYCIMCNGTTVIGLFVDMFQSNILTFNPGLAPKDNTEGDLLEAWRAHSFTDVREIQARLRAKGVSLLTEISESENPTGPGSILLQDPDGNKILIDQFFDRPKDDRRS